MRDERLISRALQKPRFLQARLKKSRTGVFNNLLRARESTKKASMATIHVDIVSAEGEIFSGEASMVFAPAVMGDIGIAPRHAPLLTTLKPGEVRVQTPGGGEQFFYVSGGAIEIQPHLITVLADTALRAKDLDEAAALQAKQRAEEALRDRGGKIGMAEAQAELARAAAQLQTIKRLRQIRE